MKKTSLVSLSCAFATLALSGCVTMWGMPDGKTAAYYYDNDDATAHCGVANYAHRAHSGCDSAPVKAAAKPAPVVHHEAPVAAPVAAPKPDLRKQVYFDTASSKINDKYDAEITEAAAALKANEGSRAEVQGYADARGSLSTNQKLAKTRAQAVGAALESHGIASSRIELVKPAQAVESRTADANAQANGRRVEIRVYKK